MTKKINGKTFDYVFDDTEGGGFSKKGKEYNVDNGQVSVLNATTTISTEKKEGIDFPAIESTITLQVTSKYVMKNWLGANQYKPDNHEPRIKVRYTLLKDSSGNSVSSPEVLESSVSGDHDAVQKTLDGLREKVLKPALEIK